MYLSKETINKYKTINRKRAEEYCNQKHDKSSVIISISDTWDIELPEVYCSDTNNVKAILSLSFDDVEKEDKDNLDGTEYCMSFTDGNRIATFINNWYNKVDTIIVHCDGGVSRSAGVTAAIMRVKEGDDWPIFNNRNKHPNMTCYLRTLKGFHYI